MYCYEKESAAQFQGKDLSFKRTGVPGIQSAVHLSFAKKHILFKKQSTHSAGIQIRIYNEENVWKGKSTIPLDFHGKAPTTYQVQHFYFCNMYFPMLLLLIFLLVLI